MPYFAIGTLFGFVLIRAEVVSWFRIQEMFRFQSFHMYGIIGSAVIVAAMSLALIRRLGVRAIDGSRIELPAREMKRGIRYPIGGALFGVGWALTGACPGPLVALIGAGVGAMTVSVLAALLGTLAYGYVRRRLPH